MKCTKCGIEFNSNYCPNCGQKFVANTPSKWIKTRFAFGITNLSLGVFFMFTIFSSEGGLATNTRTMASAWFFVMTAIITIIGKQSKGLTITSIVFYSFGILYNLTACFIVPGHILLVILMTVFLTLTCVSLKDKTSFGK